MSWLPGAERYREPPVDDKRRRKGGSQLVADANMLPIQTVLKDFFGTFVPEDLSGSWKTRCPFGFEHADGGVDGNFRVYPTNTAYCFAMHGGLSPVRLIMLQRDMAPIRAAQVLADKYELRQREPYWKKMERLVLESETEGPNAGSPQHAVEAMSTALERLGGYIARQYDEPILNVVEDRLEQLDVAIRSRREGAVREWLEITVRRVAERLEEQ